MCRRKKIFKGINIDSAVEWLFQGDEKASTATPIALMGRWFPEYCLLVS
jgi:hypothetical protein